MGEIQHLLEQAAQLVAQSPCTFALTGAGVSTESGIPDYRSAGTGLWQQVDPMRISSASALHRDPAAFYRANLERWMSYRDVEPNPAHYALARLEELGYLAGLITQNVDSLHRRAGSRRVWEVHGHLRTCHCLRCAASYPMEEAARQFRGGINPPLCGRCGGVLRPDVVLFEDPMGRDYQGAVAAMGGCHLLLVVGSSLQVYPVAFLPELARQVIIINRDPTPWDDRAACVLRGNAGDILPRMVELLDRERGRASGGEV